MEEEKKEQEVKEEEKIEKKPVDYKKRMKNYLSIIVLLAGLLVGSIFVDVAQFVSQRGISPRALRQLDVVPLEGRTWVAYSEPVVTVEVVNDDKCEACDVTDAVKMMKRVMPTLLVKEVQYDSEDGEKLIEDMKIKSLPAFVFDDSVTKTDIYTQAKDVFNKEGDYYTIDAAQLGKPGKYLTLPEVSPDDAQTGPEDAKVKVVVFSDFQCPYCGSFYEQTLKKALAEYKDKVNFVFKEIPLASIHDKAQDAALAAECANDQGKFWEFADKLYGDQKTWSAAKTFNAVPYAQAVGINMAQFNQCMSSKKFADKITADNKEAQDFGISGTPAVFVGDKFFGGMVSYDQFKQAIDEQLAK
ncbi:MAG: thioredoxin domain-containing protein [Candidatus Moranbacteria bacterium]|nr:thioredoxin domain-containing protein [Candidatus Moranbacteria bacterium]